MASEAFDPGFRLGKYAVLSHIATGGMGEVYQARDIELGRLVALKVLPKNLAENPRVLERFRHEARHVARLNHPNIVTLFECGHDIGADVEYLTMEFIDGVDLEKHIEKKGKIAPEEARHILLRVAKALRHAHEHGLVHRDIKPANIMLARVQEKVVVKLTDFGLARVVDDDTFKLTREGSTVGTVDYMSPEQSRDSRSADIRSDIYSLGCTAYHMLAGKPPFGEGGLGERVYHHLKTPPVDVRAFSPTVSDAFWHILKKMLAKKPADRYQTPEELVAELKVTSAEGKSPPLEPEPPSVELTPEQARAESLFARASEVIAQGKGDDYARDLLNQCLGLDPFSPTYRRVLRELNRKTSAGWLMGSFGFMAAKSKLQLARTAKNWRKVLDHGEELLAVKPNDVETHLEMSEAARELGQPDLAVWLLEDGRKKSPDQADLARALAKLHEARREWGRAIETWKSVVTLDPTDRAAERRVSDLTAQQHLAGHYGK